MLDTTYKLTKSTTMYSDEWYYNRVQPRGGPQLGVLPVMGPELKVSRKYRMSSPDKPELGEGTHGAGPFKAVLYSNSCAAKLWHGHLTYL